MYNYYSKIYFRKIFVHIIYLTPLFSLNIVSLIYDLEKLANPEKARILARFFKTWLGQYGEWDLFLGITVPEQRKIAKNYTNSLDFPDITILLSHKIHEYRLIWLLVLTYQFEKADTKKKKYIYDFYLSQTSFINNWDLVDLTAYKIIGYYLLQNQEELTILKTLAHSTNLWERRIAIISTFAFIKSGIYKPTFEIAEILLFDKQDLIHKAVGWMLREVGKRINENIEEEFLQKYADKMPRTMLRYAIERFEEEKRKSYLEK